MTSSARSERRRGAPATATGNVVLVEAAAGLGKTALLRAARDLARDQGFTVLSAVAAELDRGFPFGLVHQLLDGVLAGASSERRERLLSGAAGRAARVLEPGDQAGAEPDFSVLHGLYWLVANLADEAPVALLVDDLHWGDRPSLRVLEYLGRRLEGVGVLLVATSRPDEPGADAEMLGALKAGPATTVLRPELLSADAAAVLLAGVLGREPEPAFLAACV
jgi:predicted ATPase